MTAYGNVELGRTRGSAACGAHLALLMNPRLVLQDLQLTRRNGLRLCQERFKLDIRKKFFMERGVKTRNSHPRAMVGSASLEVFKNHMFKALEDMV